MIKQYCVYGLLAASAGMAACGAKGDDPGLEFSPQMYHSVPYEPLSQVTDQEAGTWLSSIDDGVGEFYNSNSNNPYAMTQRVPPANTVRRNAGSYVPANDQGLEADKYLPYRLPADSLKYASRVLKNPLDSTDAVVGEGQALYAQYCYPCHGGNGQGDGPVGQVYKGVPKYNQGVYKEMTGGHIFHVITYGKGRMNPHGSQVSVEDRWKIVRYVQTLQQQP